MKKLLIIAAMAASCIMADAQDIKLPTPQTSRKTMMVSEALATRHSVRQYSKKELSLQDLSDLCWAAVGINRPDGRLTSPTARNKQEIRLYVFDKKNVYEYIASENKLKFRVAGDHRKLLAEGPNFSQEFVYDAPVTLVMVIDFEKFGSQDEHARTVSCVDAGIVSENINLFCQAAGLVTVPRAMMDATGIRSLIGLSGKFWPVMNNPVGYPVK